MSMRVLRTNTKRVAGGPSNDGLAVDPKLARPLRDRLGPSCFRACQMAIAAGVVVLGFGVSPSTVGGFVVPVVVDTVDGGPRAWTRPHVGVEAGEVLPALAYGDAASSVMVECRAVRIAAPVLHLSPRGILGRPLHPMSAAGFTPSGAHLAPEAPAGLAFAAVQYGRPNDTYGPARAAHGPARPREPKKNGPPTECIACLNSVHGHIVVLFGTERKG